MRSVTTPLEININGADGLQYMQSYSSANGTSAITCTFALGTDPTTDQTNVQHGVDLTLSQLPQAVQNQGVSVQKSSGNITIAVAMLSTSSAVSDVAVSNYADLNVIENLKRVPGVGQVEVLGDRTYGMRIWVDPAQARSPTTSRSTRSSTSSSRTTPTSRRARSASRRRPGRSRSRFRSRSTGGCRRPRSSSRSSCRRSPTAATCASATSRRSSWARRTTSRRRATTARRPSCWRSRASRRPTRCRSRKNVRATMARIAQTMPTGIAYKIAFDTSDFVRASIKEVVVTLLIAILLVVLVIFIFLQSWHSTLIPAITIPVSLIGTFAAMKLLGLLDQHAHAVRIDARDRPGGGRRHRRAREHRAPHRRRQEQSVRGDRPRDARDRRRRSSRRRSC